METQLRDRYLRDRGLTHGIYLVGWFVCHRWTGATIAGRAPAAADTIEAFRHQVEAEAERLSADGEKVRFCVLDLCVI